MIDLRVTAGTRSATLR